MGACAYQLLWPTKASHFEGGMQGVSATNFAKINELVSKRHCCLQNLITHRQTHRQNPVNNHTTGS